MAKFYGYVGYGETKETAPGVWEEEISQKTYYGDIIKDRVNFISTGRVNDDIKVNNTVSIIADAYAYHNFHKIKYIEWMGVLWEVTNVEVQRPRLILTLGGVYNEQ